MKLLQTATTGVFIVALIKIIHNLLIFNRDVILPMCQFDICIRSKHPLFPYPKIIKIKLAIGIKVFH